VEEGIAIVISVAGDIDDFLGFDGSTACISTTKYHLANLDTIPATSRRTRHITRSNLLIGRAAHPSTIAALAPRVEAEIVCDPHLLARSL
jgi:hypothetical protein